MKGLSDTYVESVIRAFAKGRMTARQEAAKLGITRQYANKLRKAYAEEGRHASGTGTPAERPRLGRTLRPRGGSSPYTKENTRGSTSGTSLRSSARTRGLICCTGRYTGC